MLALATWQKVLLLIILVPAVIVAVGFILALFWFARAISGKDDTPPKYPDGSGGVSENN